jgi:hypothetical protein
MDWLRIAMDVNNGYMAKKKIKTEKIKYLTLYLSALSL